ncbi:MAG: hypothetical protein IPJ00_12990 [Saprospirales bacterium]|nr:hypothetical protein [Saprospirales bacterium]
MNRDLIPVALIFTFLLFHHPARTQGPGDDCGQPGQVLNGFNINLPPSGEAQIEACHFSRYGCDIPGGFSYSFSANPADTEMTVTCDDVGAREVFIWIWDAAGNSVKVHTFLLVQDNLFECPGQGAACSPVVQAISGMTLAIPGTGTATVPARDFDRGTYLSNCSSGMDFTFSFRPILPTLCEPFPATMISETLLSRSGRRPAVGSRLT